MMKIILPFRLLALISLFLWQSTGAQNVQFAKRPGLSLPKVKSGEEFHFLQQEIDTVKLTAVGRFKASFSDRATGFEELFTAIRDQAKKAGANAFRPYSYFENDSLHQISLTLDTYFATPDVLDENERLTVKNTLYIFTAEKFDSAGLVQFMLNNKVVKLGEGAYLERRLRLGEVVTVHKPGFESIQERVVGDPEAPSTYLMMIGGYGVSHFRPEEINLIKWAGHINRVDRNFGELLKLIFAVFEYND
jgi:hypothetical protein